MTEYYRELFSGDLHANYQTPIRQLMALLPDDMEPRERVKAAQLACSETQAFLVNACEITKIEQMRQRFIKYLDVIQSAESFARGSRKHAQELRDGKEPMPRDGDGEIRKRFETPKWYQQYLETPYWKDEFRSQVLAYYPNMCVLCPVVEPLQVHHKTYDTLGRERMEDVCLLCCNHHRLVHQKGLIAFTLPNDPPEAVVKLLAL